ncbi:LuxR family transcriptional regulator [Streptomyces sp. FH025]|uniref:helix-turn-helix transcriptional regulator n=1 Tax=Streptomyces sp. FH025 TaxID=2815937 RepID=UPI001A9F7AE1|nr:LuxR family transcriptional regulator [Streptomyces sp. FH025]MBO1414069.1 AAA family ATPase [Streptomyces sp. FH025]
MALLRVPSDAEVLCERTSQLGFLHQLFTDVRDGRSHIAVVTGAVGHGKTSLLRTFVDQVAAEGATVFAATASRTERPVPFGVLTQLFRAADLPERRFSQVWALIEEAQTVLGRDTGRTQPDGQAGAQIFHALGMAVLDLIDTVAGPLVITVDDAHNADLPSLQCIADTLRRARSAQVLVVLAETYHAWVGSALTTGELPAESRSPLLRLEPLTPTGVERMLADHLGRARARAVGAEAYAVTGGNPLLLRGLIEDNRRGQALQDELVVGPGYDQALVNCLYRCDPWMAALARQLSVLERVPSTRLLARMVGYAPEVVEQLLDALQTAGVLAGSRFRHPRGRAAVVRWMSAESRAALHARTAELLFEYGGSAITVARQLIAADCLGADCFLPVLHEAAEQALAEGDVELARDCLRLGSRRSAGEQEQAATAAMLVRAEWYSDPFGALRRVPMLTEAALAGHLTGSQLAGPVNALLWFGQPEEAGHFIDRMDGLTGSAGDRETGRQIQVSRRWLAILYPALAGAVPEDPDATGCARSSSLHTHALDLLRALLTGGARPELLAEAEQALRRYPLNERTLPVLLAALLTLLVGERAEEAGKWAESVSRQVPGSAPLWRAMLGTIRAEIAVWRGDLRAAGRDIRAVLDELPVRSWGIAIGLPLSIVMRVATLTGEDCPDLFKLQGLVPDTIFQTPIGLRYLEARGRYQLALGQVQAALDDFLTIGRLAAQWGMDVPSLVPWRVEAARALLQSGKPDAARQLAAEQLNRCAPGEHRARATALMVLAACSTPGERVKLLTRAVDALALCEAPVELAFALNDLAWTHQELGQFSKGHRLLRRAQQLAETTGLALPTRGAAGAGEGEAGAGREGGEEGLLDILSDAELRVCSLAARGMSNRQIATTLFVTVSTVEQHLTRVYRKLNIKRRTDLAAAMQQAGPPDGLPRSAA